jgi:Zn-dependent protease with chaperone function
LLVEGRLDPGPLAGALVAAGYSELRVRLDHPSVTFSRCSLRPYEDSEAFQRVAYQGHFDIRGSSPPAVLWTFGYRPRDFARFAPLGLVLLFPVGLTLARRWLLRRRADEDAVAAWYRQWWFQRRLIVVTWCAWLLALLLLDVPAAAFFVVGYVGGALWPVAIALGVYLPVAALGTAKVLAHPLFGAVPETGWTRSNLIRQSLLGQLAVLLPAVLTTAGVAALLADRRLLGALLVIAAAFSGLVGLGAWLLSLGRARTPFPPGEIRDRVFELAVRAGVRVQQVYLLPAACWRLVNVFAAPGKSVHVADTLVRQLSKREVDALLAHELTYFWGLRLRSIWFFPLLALGGLIPLGLLLVVGFVFFGFSPGYWRAMCVLLGLVLVLVQQPFGLRRFAPRTDAGAARVTGDAEALITALAKLTRLGLLPLHSPRRPRDCPANAIPFERLERIAERADIPPERLDEVLQDPATGTEYYSPLAPGTEPTIPTSKTFATEFKARRTALAWTNLAVAVVVPGLTVFAAEELAVSGGFRWLFYLAGLALAVGLRQLAGRVMAVRLTVRLQERLRQELAAEGFDPSASGGVFVGLAPDPCPRVYDGYFDWDVGFLFVGADVLGYAGERARFALRRGQIKDIHLGPGHPAWKHTRRIYLAWQDEEGTGGTLNLHPSDVRSLWQSGTPVRELAARLREWWEKPGAGATAPAALARLPAPRIGSVPSVSPRQLVGASTLVALALIVPILAGILAAALGLPADAEHFGGWAYALLGPLAVEMVTLLPYLRCRDAEPGDSAQT